jgi:Ca2+-transporting ATPase
MRPAAEAPLADGQPIEELRPAEVYSRMGSRSGGLSTREAARRLSEAGPNTLAPPPEPHFVRRFFASFAHVMAVLLWIGGGVAFLARLPQLGIAIWAVNVINGVFSFWQEFKAEKATEALRRLLPSLVTVLRDGEMARLPAEAVVPGDVLVLAEGDRVAADARLVEQFNLRVDQSTLTGESRPVRKTADPVSGGGQLQESANLVLAGTSVAAGTGRCVVIATGAGTVFGRVASLTESLTADLSPLQREMKRLSYIVSVVAVAVGAAFFALALLLGDLSPARGFVFALGMIVAFVPEGLLPTVTLALAMATQRMARRNALVKRLSAVETLGSATVICTDKTGTLTENEMTVVEVCVAGGAFVVTGAGYEPRGELVAGAGAADGAGAIARETIESAAMCSNARLVYDESANRWTPVGDPTEVSLVVAAMKVGWTVEASARQTPRTLELPFDAVRRRMSTVHRTHTGPIVITKGAPHEVVDLCTVRSTPGGSVPMSDDERDAITSDLDRLGRSGYRVLGVARRPVEGSGPDSSPEELEHDLEFLGLVAMHDPPRPEVAAAVDTCRRAGIRVVMITGDYGVTAEAVGRRIGLFDGGEVRVINGVELDAMSDDELAGALDGQVMFARAAPEQKLRVVTALQRSGHVVAVTGDGVNDAPALKRADIGVAMGLVGTDVAKEAADVILLDDNFASIVGAVEEGRAVYENIRRFTTYILTSNTPEAVPFVVFALSGGRIPIALDVMHILAVDLGTDMVPALALGAEPPQPGLMDRPPRAASDHVIDRRLLVRAYGWLGPPQAAFVMAAFFFQYWTNGFEGQWFDLPATGSAYRAAAAMALAGVVATQIGNLFTQRAGTAGFLAGARANRMLWWGIGSELAVIAALVYVPWFNDVFGTAPFPAQNWLWLMIGIPLLPLVDTVRKRLARARRS